MESIFDSAEAGRAFFTRVVEPLCDAFDPALCEVYAGLFSGLIERALPRFGADEILSRYGRIREIRPFHGEPRVVSVLSRVTLGADIAVTSVVLDGVKKRFPRAEIRFVGPAKNYELFASDPRIRHIPFAYPRTGTVRERISLWEPLAAALEEGLVVDPDSRLTQLGLLPVCEEERCVFFESRSYGVETEERLSVLTQSWLREALGVDNAVPYIAPVAYDGAGAGVTVSLGVGGNPRKRVSDPFEAELLRIAAGKHATVLVDAGAGGEEAERVKRAIVQSGAGNITVWAGSFAGFAARIARSRLYIGYDSAGAHAASACGVPLVSVFAGAPSRRFLQRWRPDGMVIEADSRGPDPASLARALREAIAAI